jgi:hypothetical protein
MARNVIPKQLAEHAPNFEIRYASQDFFCISGVAIGAVALAAINVIATRGVMIDTGGWTTWGLNLGQRRTEDD